jgi:hypothetical protein
LDGLLHEVAAREGNIYPLTWNSSNNGRNTIFPMANSIQSDFDSALFAKTKSASSEAPPEISVAEPNEHNMTDSLNSDDTVNWEDIKSSASNMFHVWGDGGELEWAEECWGHFKAKGLAGNSTILERTGSLLRLVTLACIYEEFAGLAWDENPESGVDYLSEDLEIDPLALGILAAAACPDNFNDAGDEYELREAALVSATNAQRGEIFACLCAAYGDEIQLYSRMARTYPSERDGDEFDVTGGNCRSLQFVQDGFPA